MSNQQTRFNNILIVDIDTDRKETVQIRKPEHIIPPVNETALKNVLLADLTTLCEGIVTVAYLIEKEGIQTKDKTLEKVISHLKCTIESTICTDVRENED